MGSSPAILHGGYAEDEPALHRAWSPDIPVLVGRDRVQNAQHAQQQGATVVVLDDGFQHRRLERDLDIVLIAAERWTGVHRVLPRGPWREPRGALRRADLVVVTRKTAARDVANDVCRSLGQYGVSASGIAHIAPAGWAREDAAAPPPREPALAVAALAEPSLFVDNATAAGARIRAVRAYADHHEYSAADARDIADAAGSAPIITTEKDWMKLRGVLRAEQVWILMQRVQIEAGEDVLDARLRALVTAAASA
jgi:tetraacyldisaccharide 4'-kinase